jgi:threonine-phosphate decarboxylase
MTKADGKTQKPVQKSPDGSLDMDVLISQRPWMAGSDGRGEHPSEGVLGSYVERGRGSDVHGRAMDGKGVRPATTQMGVYQLGVHGGNIRLAQEKYGLKMNDILDFSANINPLGLASSVRAAVLDNIEHIVHYPDPEARSLKQTIARYYTLPMEQIVVGNGAVELIYVLAHHLRPRRVLMPAPTFSEYERAIRGIDGELVFFPLNQTDDFRLNIQSFMAALEEVDMCFLCNPNNPVGTITAREDIEKIIQAAAAMNVWVVVDESFLDFVPESASVTCRHLVTQYTNVIILHSLTKFFAIPGLRLGFSVMPPCLAQVIDLAKDPWNVNNLAQSAGVAALQDNTYITESVALIQREKQFMYDELNQIRGLRAYPPSVNFVFLRLEHPDFDAPALADATAQAGILVRDCSSYPTLDSNYIRVAVKQRADNEKLLALLRRLLG